MEERKLAICLHEYDADGMFLDAVGMFDHPEDATAAAVGYDEGRVRVEVVDVKTFETVGDLGDATDPRSVRSEWSAWGLVEAGRNEDGDLLWMEAD